MEGILLVLVMLVVFSFGYFLTYRFGKFVHEYFRDYWEPRKHSGK